MNNILNRLVQRIDIKYDKNTSRHLLVFKEPI